MCKRLVAIVLGIFFLTALPILAEEVEEDLDSQQLEKFLDETVPKPVVDQLPPADTQKKPSKKVRLLKDRPLVNVPKDPAASTKKSR